MSSVSPIASSSSGDGSPAFTTSPSSSTPTAPPPPGGNDDGNDFAAEAHSSTSLLFGFLIAFLSLFVLFMLCGMLWRHYTERRRRARRAALDAVREKKLNDKIPKLWELHIENSDSADDWKQIMPLSAGIVHSSETSLDTAQEIEQDIARSNTLFDRIINFVLRLPYHYPGTTPPEPVLPVVRPKPKKDERSHVAEKQEHLQVAVLVAMPEPPRKPSSSRDASGDGSSSSQDPVPEFREYALGVTEVHWDPSRAG
ncbi:hypothetical protein SISSUDRAFT_1050273 [Sistotremastrum suecicum HHB10207 ss-3]|uniref:Uncharacterized protein n=1 Tax=Sistotremastrum suecicum HHB10207 ss-3 TaxID=1314776 RepID=A0A166BA99_9AGAM|nr:hypothetical protein SISSUDRAFT_1050273 [Sistotremastrum suecicum HHB10207 ss-3]